MTITIVTPTIVGKLLDHHRKLQRFIDSKCCKNDIAHHINATMHERKEVHMATQFKQAQVKRPPLKAKPRADANIEQIANEITERFSVSLAYLAR